MFSFRYVINGFFACSRKVLISDRIKMTPAVSSIYTLVGATLYTLDSVLPSANWVLELLDDCKRLVCI